MSTSTTLEAGVVLDGRYRLTEALGGGGMGQVWAATHTKLGHSVAIKVLHGSVMASAEPRARFEREARLMAQLGEMSRHITRVAEHGVMDDGVPFLVMELLRGEGLDVRLKREKVLPLDVVADLTSQLCRALSVAHERGVVHRDIKPANVFLTTDEDGRMFVKLLDFGVAKALAETGEQTVSGQVIGTPNYMSPEQLTGEVPVDHRADLFAVGSIVYRAATGKAAFGKGNISEMAMRIISATPPPPSTINPNLGPEFDAFIARALAKSPSSRFQSAKELAEALQAVVRGMGAAASSSNERVAAAESGHVTLGTESGVSQSAFPALQPAPRARARERAAMAIVGVAFAVATGLFVVRSSSHTSSVAPAPNVAPNVAPAPPSAIPPASVAAVSAPVLAASVPPPASASAAPPSEPVVSAAPPPRVPARVLTGRPGRRPEGGKPEVQDTWRKRDEM